MLIGTDALRGSGSDQLKQRFAGGAIAVFLCSLESLGMHRQHGNAFLLADRLQTASTSSPMMPTMQVA